MRISLTCLIVAAMFVIPQVLQNYMNKENKTYVFQTISIILFFAGVYFAMRGK